MITNPKFYAILDDRDEMQNRLTFFSLFVLVVENFISIWKDAIFILYVNCKEAIDNDSQTFICEERFHRIDKNYRELHKNIFEIYEQEVFNIGLDDCKKREKAKKLFIWMTKYGFIDDKDKKVLNNAYQKRTDYAHETDKYLIQEISFDEKKLLKDFIAVAEKASQNMVRKVILPSREYSKRVEFVDENGNPISPAECTFPTGSTIFYQLVTSILEK